MTIGMTLHGWWARLTGWTMTRDQAFAAAALTAEGMHISRQLQRSPELPVSDSERQWWRQHFGPPERYVGPSGAPSFVHTNLVDRVWGDRWGRLSPQAQAASWTDWERRGLAERTSLGTYQVIPAGGVTVLQEMWGNEYAPGPNGAASLESDLSPAGRRHRSRRRGSNAEDGHGLLGEDEGCHEGEHCD
jgi:hypothetical protein